MNFEIVLSPIRKLYINSLNVAPVVMCLSVIPSFSLGSNGCMKINKSKKILIIDMCFTILSFRFMYRLFNVLCWIWNIYEGAELPGVYFITTQNILKPI